MAKIVNGRISGKVGNLVYYTRHGVSFVRQLPRKSNKPKTAGQLEQQAKMALAARILNPVSYLFKTNYKRRPGMTGYNQAFQQVMRHAITGHHPGLGIDYSALMFSKGPVPELRGLVQFCRGGNLMVGWDPDANGLTTFMYDQIFILCYEPKSGTYLYGPEDVMRYQGVALIALPQFKPGETLHTYVYCVTHNGQTSDSVYAGEVVVS